MLESEDSEPEEEPKKEMVLKNPEQFAMVEKELSACLASLKQKRQGADPGSLEEDYSSIKKQAVSCYATNLLFYLLLESKGKDTKEHPLILRLAYLKSMLQ